LALALAFAFAFAFALALALALASVFEALVSLLLEGTDAVFDRLASVLDELPGLRLSTGGASSSLTVEQADSSIMSATSAAVSLVKRMVFPPWF
jgi:hypothetical protein